MGGGNGLDASAIPEKEGKDITLRNKGYDHEGYHKRGGLLYKEDYKTVLDRARDYQRLSNVSAATSEPEGVRGHEKDPRSAVQKMLNHLDIHKQFSANNQQEVFLFQAIKDFLQEHPEVAAEYEKSKHTIITDEQILAEAYKILGDEESQNALNLLKERNKHPPVR